MEKSALRSLTKTPSSSFPKAPPTAANQPPLLPLPAAQAPSSPQHYSFWPAPRAKKPRCHAAPNPRMASAPITVAAPSKKRPATEWTETDSLYSVSPPPSCVPMPTSLLVTVAAARKVSSTACAVEVAAGAAGAVDVGATDELRRLLRL